jgi:hypothetical protein
MLSVDRQRVPEGTDTSGTCMTKIKLFTIGFTKTNAENFFTKLRDAGVK